MRLCRYLAVLAVARGKEGAEPDLRVQLRGQHVALELRGEVVALVIQDLVAALGALEAVVVEENDSVAR